MTLRKPVRPPRIRGNSSSPRASAPTHPLKFPWRFLPGDWVTVVGWDDHRCRVTEGFYHGCFPHYVISDMFDRKWRVSQLKLVALSPLN